MSETLTDRSALSREEKLALLAHLARQKERAARTFPLTFAQQRLWFLARLEPENHANHIFRALVWRGPLDAGALRRALAEVVRRHESLRTTFPEMDGEPRQKAAPGSSRARPRAGRSGVAPRLRPGARAGLPRLSAAAGARGARPPPRHAPH